MTKVNNTWVRIDSVTGSLYRYNPGNDCDYYFEESFIDSLAALKGDELKKCGTLPTEANFRCNNVDTTTLFSTHTIQKSFVFSVHVGPYNTSTEITYVKNFGVSYWSHSGFATYAYGTSLKLKGCIVNGVLYGDTSTTTVGVNNLSSAVPLRYLLYQNFPNPFNPSTTIRFDLPKKSEVILKVYDILGHEMSKLFAGRLEAGSYNYSFEGSNLSSGVYIYRLTADGVVIDSKRMLLVK